MSTSSFRTLVLASLLLYSLPAAAEGKTAGATSTTAAKPCVPKAQPVDIESTDTGWVVSRTGCPNEDSGVLTYSYADVSRDVEGTRTGDVWTFAIADRIPADAILKLEFQVFVPEASVDATLQVGAFSASIRDAVKVSFDDAVAQTENVAPADRWAVLLAQFSALARTRVSALATAASLPYFANKVPVVDYVLTAMHFQKLENGDWQPTAAVLDDLKKLNGPAKQELDDAQSYAEKYRADPSPTPACLGDKASFVTSNTKAARDKTIADCFKAMLEAAANANVTSDDLTQLKAVVTGHSDAEVAKELVNIPTLDRASAQSVRTELIEADNHAAMLRVSRAIHETERKSSGPGATPTSVAYLKAEAAVEFVAALEVPDQIQTALAAAVEAAFPLPDLTVKITFLREATASQLLKITAGKPRFFVSTGVAVTSLNDNLGSRPNKIAIPILVSICWSKNGCETKGFGSGGKDLNYLSTDLGVKAVFIGQKNPREGAPSFLLGVGITPIYATHLSLGVNLFENPQTREANVAGYLAITLDTVDGAGILGALGLGKPSADVISGAPNSDGTKNK